LFSSLDGQGASGSRRNEATKPTAAAKPVKAAKLPEKTSMTMRWGLGSVMAAPSTRKPKGVRIRAAKKSVRRAAGVLAFTFFP